MMARKIQTCRRNSPSTFNSHPPATSIPPQPTNVSPRLHTNFMEVKVHTAKCDSCNKHNKLTLYRCTDCGQHVCSLCWAKQSEDGTHLFGGGFRNVPELNTDQVREDDDADVEKKHENESRSHARRRAHVVSDDEEENLPVLKPAPTTEKAKTIDASERPKKRIDVIMTDENPEDHEDGLPTLWPIAPARKLPVLRPAVPAAKTSASESANRETQRSPQIREESNPERQRIGRIYDNLGRQVASSQYAFVGDQETDHQARRPAPRSISQQQAIRYAPLHAQPAIYRPQPGADVDRQAARNQHGFANSQPTNRQAPRPAQPMIVHFANSQPTNRQAPRPAQPIIAHQQATHLAPRQAQPAIYRPRPGADLDQQAARNSLAFADRQRINHQAPRPAQASISQQYAQTAGNADTDRTEARNKQAFRLNQQAQAYANAKQWDARNQQALSSHHNARPTANRDHLAAHNQQAFISAQQSISGADYVAQMVAAQKQQQAFLSRQQANRPTPGQAQTSVPHRDATEPSAFPAQSFLSQQHAALLASRQAQGRIATPDRPSEPSRGVQVQERSHKILEAADALLFYAGVEQVPGARLRSDQDANGFSQLLNAAGHIDRASSARSESRSSSKPLVAKSGIAGTQSVSPRGPASNPSPRSTDADSANARLEKHRARFAALHSPSGTRKTFSDLPARLRGHPSQRHAALQPDSGPALADYSAAQDHGSSYSGARSHPDQRRSVSDHAATYLNQWNSGRAALSSSSASTVANVPATQIIRPRSPVPAPHPHSTIDVQDITASGNEPEEAAEASTQALSASSSVSGGTSDVDVAMGDPDVDILEEGESPSSEASTPQTNPWTTGNIRDADMARARIRESISGLLAEGKAEKHQRGEKEGIRKTSKEQKASGDVDVVDARKRNGKEKPSEQSDDDVSDIEITSWNKLDSHSTTGEQGGTNAGAKGAGSGRSIKKGVAHVKKPEPKGQKGKTTATYVG